MPQAMRFLPCRRPVAGGTLPLSRIYHPWISPETHKRPPGKAVAPMPRRPALRHQSRESRRPDVPSTGAERMPERGRAKADNHTPPSASHPPPLPQGRSSNTRTATPSNSPLKYLKERVTEQCLSACRTVPGKRVCRNNQLILLWRLCRHLPYFRGGVAEQ